MLGLAKEGASAKGQARRWRKCDAKAKFIKRNSVLRKGDLRVGVGRFLRMVLILARV